MTKDHSEVARSPVAIVGIGASAGGIEALQGLFHAMPTETGLAFVVVQHLSPEHESHMVDVLRRHTHLPVVAIEDGVRVERDRVYLIPPDRELTISNATLHLSEMTASQRRRWPIDRFLCSLAEDQKEHAIGIILSGVGSAGTVGIKEIKKFQGCTLAQAPESARHAGMPSSAIASGMIDLLPPETMPDALLRLARRFDSTGAPEVIKPAEEDIAALSRILNLMQVRAGYDFRLYRKNTLMRRIRRRLGLHSLETLSEYEALLRQDAAELRALAKDMMINVTGFFRDPEAWEVLKEKVIRPLVHGRADGEPIRVWVPACATGEEAYTLAVLIAEQAEAARKTFEVKTFATDTAEDSLGPARRGIFPAAIEHAIPQERLRRFSEPVGDMYHWRVVDEERKLIVRRRWQESGGPEVKPPTRSGFGLGLIKRAVSYELDGTTMVEFRPEGFRCEIALPYRPELFQVH